MPEVIEQPLSYEQLAEKYRQLCEDPLFANVPGKLELDTWGRVLMSPPPPPNHGKIQARLARRASALGGEAYIELPIVTQAGLLVPDVAWASTGFVSQQDESMPFVRAPERCIDVASHSNSRKELSDKVAADLAAGATEAWIAFAQSKRLEIYGSDGPMERTAFAIDLSGLFD